MVLEVTYTRSNGKTEMENKNNTLWNAENTFEISNVKLLKQQSYFTICLKT